MSAARMIWLVVDEDHDNRTVSVSQAYESEDDARAYLLRAGRALLEGAVGHSEEEALEAHHHYRTGEIIGYSWYDRRTLELVTIPLLPQGQDLW